MASAGLLMLLDDIAALLSQRGDDRQHPFDEAASICAVGAERQFAPDDGRTE